MKTITMKAARAMFANRHTAKPAETDEHGNVTKPRVRKSLVRGRSFRRWARDFYEGEAHLSPKLARVVRVELKQRVA